jgi:hypothetical protein
VWTGCCSHTCRQCNVCAAYNGHRTGEALNLTHGQVWGRGAAISMVVTCELATVATKKWSGRMRMWWWSGRGDAKLSTWELTLLTVRCFQRCC